MTDGLEYRIEKSIALLRKAEKLAKMYDPEDGFFLAFSGGKDSQALYHIAKLAGVAFKAHFTPTSVDPPQVLRFIRKQYPEKWSLQNSRSPCTPVQLRRSAHQQDASDGAAKNTRRWRAQGKSP